MTGWFWQVLESIRQFCVARLLWWLILSAVLLFAGIIAVVYILLSRRFSQCTRRGGRDGHS